MKLLTQLRQKVAKLGERGGTDRTSDGHGVDYQELVDQTIKSIKQTAQEKDLDYQKLLEAEKQHKDRKTMVSWIEDRLED